MIYETAILRIRPGVTAEFEDAVERAAPLFQRADGALSFQLHKRVETPQEYVLVVGWSNLEAHTKTFRSSEAFSQWRELTGPYFAAAPEVHHTTHVYTGF